MVSKERRTDRKIAPQWLVPVSTTQVGLSGRRGVAMASWPWRLVSMWKGACDGKFLEQFRKWTRCVGGGVISHVYEDIEDDHLGQSP